MGTRTTTTAVHLLPVAGVLEGTVSVPPAGDLLGMNTTIEDMEDGPRREIMDPPPLGDTRETHTTLEDHRRRHQLEAMEIRTRGMEIHMLALEARLVGTDMVEAMATMMIDDTSRQHPTGEFDTVLVSPWSGCGSIRRVHGISHSLFAY